ncbi:glycosyltransferase family 2 protein [Vibrio sp. 10N.222.51.C5]|uniref:glycosyltransferase family 2 protein n=1 Tax=Vibrio sp. 10N.222.51.C5 TaxID=3229623 RepID=UPI0035506E5E
MIVNKLPFGVRRELKKLPFVHGAYLRFLHFFKREYQQWIKKVEPTVWLPVMGEQSICFSIIVPVYNPPLSFLKECVDSVHKQTYSNWQLILVNDASTSQEVNDYLQNIADQHLEQINVISNRQNLHISLSTNEGLKQCNGDYVTFLDHDDLLAPQALNEVASAIADNSNLQWLYSDEDLMSKTGKRIAPHFKSQWNPYLLHAHNYITHLSVYKRNLLGGVGGCREGVEGAQDYDLALRVSQVLSESEIAHIPKILYHWRMHEKSTASQSGAKPYTVEAGKQALLECLENQGINASVQDGNLDNYYQVSYLPDHWPKVSIIVPTRDHKEVLETCIESVLNKTDYPDFEIIIMDNQSQQAPALEYLNLVGKNSNVKVIKYDKPFNYSEINNVAVEYSNGEVIVLLNNDTEVITASWLKEIVGLAMRPDVGCVGAKLLYPDNTIQHAGVILGLGGYAAHSHRCVPNDSNGYFNRPHVNQVLSAVTGACLAIRKETYLAVEGLDETFQVAYNDVDFCLKVQKAGFYNVYCAHAELYHYESKTRGDDNADAIKAKRFEQEKKRLLNKWFNELQDDPYYHPHLTRSAEDFSLRA